MATPEGNRKGILYLFTSFLVLYLALFQVKTICCWPETPFLSRASRSIHERDTTGSLHPHLPVYPEVPYLGTLSQPLKIGSVIRIGGYIPPDVEQFQINLCTDCSSGPIHLHISFRFRQGIVVRNSYNNVGWGTEERNGGVPLSVNQEFIILIEVKANDYRISVNGREVWIFRHRIPFSTVEKLEIKGEPIKVWKIEYSDVEHQRRAQNLQVTGDSTNVMTIHVGDNPAGMFEKFSLQLRCECTPQNSSVFPPTK